MSNTLSELIFTSACSKYGLSSHVVVGWLLKRLATVAGIYGRHRHGYVVSKISAVYLRTKYVNERISVTGHVRLISPWHRWSYVWVRVVCIKCWMLDNRNPHREYLSWILDTFNSFNHNTSIPLGSFMFCGDAYHVFTGYTAGKAQVGKQKSNINERSSTISSVSFNEWYFLSLEANLSDHDWNMKTVIITETVL